jgi:oligopeptide transport system permease protein
MLRLIFTRILAAIPTLFAVVTLSFFVMRLAPGGPFDAERGLDPEIMKNVQHAYGLDLPLYRQYGLYLWNLLHGDLGPSLHWRDFSVNDIFKSALPISMQIGAEALVLALIVGVPLGMAAAIKPYGWRLWLARIVTLCGIAVPAFVVAPLLQVGFGLDLHWLPVASWEDGDWRHQILPVFTLALPQIAVILRLTEAAMHDVLSAPFIRTLRAFGFPASHIYLHALRGACLPVLSYLGPAAAGLLTGTVVVESIFAIPGLGRYFVDGALGRDYTIVMGTVIVVAVFIIVFNLLVDLTYALVDPRVRHE